MVELPHHSALMSHPEIEGYLIGITGGNESDIIFLSDKTEVDRVVTNTISNEHGLFEVEIKATIKLLCRTDLNVDKVTDDCANLVWMGK